MADARFYGSSPQFSPQVGQADIKAALAFMAEMQRRGVPRDQWFAREGAAATGPPPNPNPLGRPLAPAPVENTATDATLAQSVGVSPEEHFANEIARLAQTAAVTPAAAAPAGPPIPGNGLLQAEAAAGLRPPVTAPPPPLDAGGLAVQGFSGFNEGLARTAGLPVDAATWLINNGVAALQRQSGATGTGSQGGMIGTAIGTGQDIQPPPQEPFIQNPFLGSEHITQMLTGTGTIRPPSEDPTGHFLRRVGQEVGAAAVPAVGLGGAAAAGVRSAGPIVGPMLEVAAARPGAFAGAELASSLGSGVGAASAQQLAPGNATAELAGQMLGAFSPAGLAAGVRTATNPLGRGNIPGNTAAFGAAGTTPSLGQATGSRAISALETTLGMVPGGAGVMAKFGAAQQAAIGSRVGRLSSALSGPATPAGAGRTIKAGIIGPGGYLERFRTEANQLFNAIPINGATPVPATNTLQTLNNLTSPIPGAPNTSAALQSSGLGNIANAFLADAGPTGVLPYEALKQLRTRVGHLAFGTDGLLVNTDVSDLRTLYGALTSDMQAAANAAGLNARYAFSRANRFYSRGAQRIDDFLNQVNRLAPPEDVYRYAMQGKDGASRLLAIRYSLTPEQWRVATSAFLNRMGRALPGQQDDVGEVFSTERFLTNWNNLHRDSRRVLFGRGVLQGGDLLGDLSRVAAAASNVRTGSRVLRNPSGTTAVSINIGGTLASTVGGATALAMGQPPLVWAALFSIPAAAGFGARRLTNPKFVRWLGQATQVPVERLPGLIARLNSMAKDDPELQEITIPFIAELERLRAGLQPSGPSSPPLQ